MLLVIGRCLLCLCVASSPDSICEISFDTFRRSNINISFVKSLQNATVARYSGWMQSLCSHRIRFIHPRRRSLATLQHSFHEHSCHSLLVQDNSMVQEARRAEKDSRTLAFLKIFLRIKWQFPMLLESSAQSSSGANHRIIRRSNVLL